MAIVKNTHREKKSKSDWNDMDELKYLICAIDNCKCESVPPSPSFRIILPPRIEEIPCEIPPRKPPCVPSPRCCPITPGPCCPWLVSPPTFPAMLSQPPKPSPRILCNLPSCYPCE
ncbi:hypothetical protein PUN28_010341 [Cardiocondyla obscurior]|uniref:Uncharacterized protein n=1 Tax=Cardiocondyla obscurior TaxID=286306 RepID=A0AAW2FNS4_9HYME